MQLETGQCNQYNDQAMVWTIEIQWFDSWQGQDVLFFSEVPTVTLQSTQPPDNLPVPV